MSVFYHITPILEERVWGGSLIQEKFHYKTDLKNIAEAYHVIAIPGHLDNMVGEEDVPLSQFYKEHRELFDCMPDELPVRLVSACAAGKLSCHLHPTDAYGLENEGMRGKVEGTYTLTEEDMDVEYCMGHTARTKEEFVKMVEQGEWDKLLRRFKGKLTDFCHTPIGTLHAEEGDGRYISIAYSSNGDVTYRLFDYERNDPKRPLNIQAVIDNVNIPDARIKPYPVKPYEKNGCLVYDYHCEPGAYVGVRLKTAAGASYEREEFMFILCTDGETEINGYRITPGETLFIPAHSGRLSFTGNADLAVLSYID